MVIYNFANISDYKKFPEAKIQPPQESFEFTKVANEQAGMRMPRGFTIKNKSYGFEEGLERDKTVAFMVIRNDTVFYENYFNGYEKESIVTSFSVAKSFVSALVGIAVAEGHIESVQDPIGKYLPYIKDKEVKAITIERVLNMRSGIKFNESYFNPFGHAAKFYYGLNIKKFVSNLKMKKEKRDEFDYISGNTAILGLIVEESTGRKLNEYMEEKLWQPLGMQYEGSLSLDSKKHRTAKAFAGLNGIAIDFAKFGRLYLQNGNWDGQQVVPEEWVNRSRNPMRNKEPFLYSYQWWHYPETKWYTDSLKLDRPHVVKTVKSGDNEGRKYVSFAADDFQAIGILGQYIFIHPEKNIIILRFGKKSGDIDWLDLFRVIADIN